MEFVPRPRKIPLFTDGGFCSLLPGCCLDVLKAIESNSVDMVLADPPYKKTRLGWDVMIPFAPLWEELLRIAKDNAAICLFGVEPFSSMQRMSNIKMFRYDWVWRKSEPTGHYNANKMPLRDIELISVFYKKLPHYESQKTGGHKRKTAKRSLRKDRNNIYGKDMRETSYDSTERHPTQLLEYSRRRQINKLHPTQKPTDLLEFLVRSYTGKGDVVLDFCMGSGSTGEACINTERYFIGIEKDEDNFNTATNRLLKETTNEKRKFD